MLDKLLFCIFHWGPCFINSDNSSCIFGFFITTSYELYNTATSTTLSHICTAASGNIIIFLFKIMLLFIAIQHLCHMLNVDISFVESYR